MWQTILQLKDFATTMLDVCSTVLLLFYAMKYYNFEVKDCLFLMILALPLFVILRFLRHKIKTRRKAHPFTRKEIIFFLILTLTNIGFSICLIVFTKSYSLEIPIAIGLNWWAITIFQAVTPFIFTDLRIEKVITRGKE